jgi:hypothetical protein
MPHHSTVKNSRSKRTRAGFTLVELMIAAVISMIIAGAVLTSYVQFQRGMETQRFLSEIQQNIRVGLEFISRDLSMAGYGFKDINPVHIPLWINWAYLPENPYIEDGLNGGADRITMAGAYERVSELAAAASNTTEITVALGTGGDFNTTTKSVIYIGRNELARIVAVAGDTLTISTAPDQIGEPLKYDYPAGTPIELVKVYTYSVYRPGADSDEPPYLRREDYAEDYDYWFNQVITSGIDDLQMERSGPLVKVALRGRSLSVDTALNDPGLEDQYRRLSMTNKVFIRNM